MKLESNSLLGDVGGLMEVILSLFKILSSFTIDILYNTSIVNNLFEFDVEKNLNIIRNKYKLKLKDNNIIINKNNNNNNNNNIIIPIINEPKNKNPHNNNINNINNDNEKISSNKISIVSKKLKDNNVLSYKDNLNILSSSKNVDPVAPKKN